MKKPLKSGLNRAKTSWKTLVFSPILKEVKIESKLLVERIITNNYGPDYPQEALFLLDIDEKVPEKAKI